MKKLPEWALREENYSAEGDSDYFITRSLLRIMKILRALRYQARRRQVEKVSAVGAIFFTALIILLCVSSHTINFLWYVLALELVILCLQDGRTIRLLLRNSLIAAIIGAMFVLPAFFMGNKNLIVVLPFKIFLTATALGLLTTFFRWHQLTSALRKFHVPAVVIFILDTTLRYIVLLGEISQDLLTALKLRSVGKNRDKKKSMSGILGVVFLKSKEMSAEMYQAMCCRCFTGEYLNSARRFLRIGDLIFLVLIVIYVGLFLILEVVNINA